MNAGPDGSRRLHPRLPVFAVETAGLSLLYVPGFVMPSTREWLGRIEADLQDGVHAPGAAAISLLRCAREVSARWQAMLDESFTPLCLSLHFPYACNLACSYCFARPALPNKQTDGGGSDIWNPGAVRKAAGGVAGNCRAAGEPMHIVIQGAGEPSLHWDELQGMVAMTREVAADHGVGWNGHLTTNGQCTPQQAGWLAAEFDSVTLSCDGPPSRQDRLRPRSDGQPSSPWVEQTARILREQAREFDVRATMPPEDAEHLLSLVDYVGHILGASCLSLELTFGRTQMPALDASLADHFLSAFAAAEVRAAGLGMRLQFSGVRLHELHGPYCDEARQVLRLTPDGTRLGCFLADDLPARCPTEDSNTMGLPVFPQGSSIPDRTIPARCWNCFNQYHCAKSCPDHCPSDAHWSQAAETRCQIQGRLALHWLEQALAASPATAAANAPPASAARELDEYLLELPPGIDPVSIRDEWTNASRIFNLKDREMPGAPWNDAGFDLSGSAAWDCLRQAAAGHLSDTLAIYVHVPFCGQHCAFCDCHSTGVRRHSATCYVQQIQAHLHAWCALSPLARRTLSTIHFGGGTPMVLGRGLSAILNSLREQLAIQPDTELAIETTATLCGKRELEHLLALGFTRLHVGVQALDGTRQILLGRRTADALVLERLRMAMEMGFITSVDILYGLPDQSPAAVGATVSKLIACGIHGLSAYRLNRSERNQAFFRVHPGFQADAFRDYVSLQCVEHLMTQAGYMKNHFVHYAMPPDDNRYFRHLVRGEDLVALGASASGNIGSLSYKFHDMPAFAAAGTSLEAALEGVCISNHANREVDDLMAHCMAGDINGAAFARCGCTALLDAWKSAALVRHQGPGGPCVLTGSGSWAMRQMLAAIDRTSDSGPCLES